MEKRFHDNSLACDDNDIGTHDIPLTLDLEIEYMHENRSDICIQVRGEAITSLFHVESKIESSKSKNFIFCLQVRGETKIKCLDVKINNSKMQVNIYKKNYSNVLIQSQSKIFQVF